MGNQVLAELLSDLISRCALITLMYQSTDAAEASNDDHLQIVEALALGDAEKSVELMDQHLRQVIGHLRLEKYPAARDTTDTLADL